MLADLGWTLSGACAAAVGLVDVPNAGVTIVAAGPNPTRGVILARVGAAAPQRVRVLLMDALGRAVGVLHDGDVTPGAGVVVRMETARLSAGVYVLWARGDAGDARRILSVVP